MRKLLEGISDAHHYIDDILVMSNTRRERMETLNRSFERLHEVNITIKPKECEIGFEEVRFLGRVIRMWKKPPDPTIIASIQDVPTKRQVRSFLGLTEFYREFVEDHARLLHS